MLTEKRRKRAEVQAWAIKTVSRFAWQGRSSGQLRLKKLITDLHYEKCQLKWLILKS